MLLNQFTFHYGSILMDNLVEENELTRYLHSTMVLF